MVKLKMNKGWLPQYDYSFLSRHVIRKQVDKSFVACVIMNSNETIDIMKYISAFQKNNCRMGRLRH